MFGCVISTSASAGICCTAIRLYNSDMVRFEPVPWRKLPAALMFIAGGDCDDFAAQSQAQSLMVLARRKPRAVWWAKDGSCTAAAAVISNPGSTGFLFHSPPDAPGVNNHHLATLIGLLCTDCLDRGLGLVQSLVDPDRQATIDVLKEAGMIELAHLAYMRRMLPASNANKLPEVKWIHMGQYHEGELGELISRTYIDSQDCPALANVRKVKDIIAGHKASGIFRPEGWLIAMIDNSPAGCVLVNDCADLTASEVVYMGVHPDFRHRGIGRRLLNKACDITFTRGIRRIELAVDLRNSRAMALYQSHGFVQVQTRLALAMINPVD